MWEVTIVPVLILMASETQLSSVLFVPRLILCLLLTAHNNGRKLSSWWGTCQFTADIYWPPGLSGAWGGGQDSDGGQRWPLLWGRPQTQTQTQTQTLVLAVAGEQRCHGCCSCEQLRELVSCQPEPSLEPQPGPRAPSCPPSSGHRRGFYSRVGLKLLPVIPCKPLPGRTQGVGFNWQL